MDGAQDDIAPPENAGLVAEKKRLRLAFKARREAIAYRDRLGRAACRHALGLIRERPGDLAAYHPAGAELDPHFLIEACWMQDRNVALPVVAKPFAPLVFRRFDHKTRLGVGVHGILHPGPEAETLVPKIVIVPLLAFDRTGARLGYGGGYYDRTLQALRRADPDVLAVGIAFSAQEADSLPVDANDQRLDAVVTETGIQMSGERSGERASEIR